MNCYQSPCEASASPLQRMQKNLHTPIALSALTGLIAIGCDVPFVSQLLHLALSKTISASP